MEADFELPGFGAGTGTPCTDLVGKWLLCRRFFCTDNTDGDQRTTARTFRDTFLSASSSISPR